MLSEYRQRFSDFHTRLYREEFLFRAGRKEKREMAHIRSEYSDLFDSAVISDLRAKLEETSRFLETEAVSIRRLIAFATEGNLNLRARELFDEIERHESTARIDWQGTEIGFHQSAELMANEADAARRRDLFARRADVINAVQDLRAEASEKMREGVQELGFENYLAMRRELRGVDFEKLSMQSDLLLSKTESRYMSALASLLPREAEVSIDDATQADLDYLRRFTRFDHFFPRERMMGVYRELFAALGFNTDRQSNLQIVSTPRQQQPQALCMPIRIPDEVKLLVNLIGGQANYRDLLREAGHAQLFAWTSRSIYPEFRIGGDRAVQEAWGLLFENLMLDEHWLAGTFGFIESAQLRRALALFRLMDVRRYAALLKYETDFNAGRLAGNAGARYAELMTDAVRVRYDDTDHLRDLDDAFYSGGFLRGCPFESQMREYLKTRFGRRWWASCKAGEMLIDLWNTGQRYTVEELSGMIGFGELDFDWLAEELQSQIEERSL
jgi:hypothetical protein